MKNLDELRKIRDEVRKSLSLRDGGGRARIVVGMGTCGIAAGARDTMKAFMEALAAEKIEDVALTATGCAGFCEREPCVDVEVKDQSIVQYAHVDGEAARRIVREHIVQGNPVSEFMV